MNQIVKLYPKEEHLALEITEEHAEGEEEDAKYHLRAGILLFCTFSISTNYFYELRDCIFI